MIDFDNILKDKKWVTIYKHHIDIDKDFFGDKGCFYPIKDNVCPQEIETQGFVKSAIDDIDDVMNKFDTLFYKHVNIDYWFITKEDSENFSKFINTIIKKERLKRL